MSEIVNNARSAREALARGLNALQSMPNAPPAFIAAAEPIAQAMGTLHRIERSQGAEVAASSDALASVRSALGMLQSQAISDPRLAQAMEAVASSLGLIFGLTKMSPPAVANNYGPPPQPPQQVPAAFAATQYANPAMQQPAAQPPYAPPPQQPAQFNPPQQQPPFAQPQGNPFAQPAQQFAPPPQQQFAPPPQQQFAPPPQQQFAPPPQQQFAPPPQQQFAPSPQPQFAPAQDPFAPPAQPQGQGAYRQPAGDSALIEAELGTHSQTNFYKGLSGNDVVDHGGLFVSTYNIPKIGSQIKLHVSLPGGYEFTCLAVVRWIRESRDTVSADISPPGFGAQLLNPSPEARQLVYRYVRNREPLFHDDL
jgi:hypothetical protein